MEFPGQGSDPSRRCELGLAGGWNLHPGAAETLVDPVMPQRKLLSDLLRGGGVGRSQVYDWSPALLLS